MGFAVSNIAWTRHDDPDVLAALRDQGVDGIEVAPTKIWPDWDGATPSSAAAYARRLADAGFAVPALQAILFGRPELSLFAERAGFAALSDHIRQVADLAAALGAHAMVFGSPRNRDRGALTEEQAFERARDAFAVLGAECAEAGSCLCIEANPEAYGCNFVTTAREGARLVRAVGSPGFGLHLDAAGMYLAGEDAVAVIGETGSFVRHFHASEPHLGSFGEPSVGHSALGRALNEAGYGGWISIEMRAAENELDAIKTACARVRRDYAPVLSPEP